MRSEPKDPQHNEWGNKPAHWLFEKPDPSLHDATQVKNRPIDFQRQERTMKNHQQPSTLLLVILLAFTIGSVSGKIPKQWFSNAASFCGGGVGGKWLLDESASTWNRLFIAHLWAIDWSTQVSVQYWWATRLTWSKFANRPKPRARTGSVRGPLPHYEILFENRVFGGCIEASQPPWWP